MLGLPDFAGTLTIWRSLVLNIRPSHLIPGSLDRFRLSGNCCKSIAYWMAHKLMRLWIYSHRKSRWSRGEFALLVPIYLSDSAAQCRPPGTGKSFTGVKLIQSMYSRLHVALMIVPADGICVNTSSATQQRQANTADCLHESRLYGHYPPRCYTS
jgi:hypothetical protein